MCSEIGKKDAESFQLFCVRTGKLMLNSDIPVLHDPAPVTVWEVSGLFFLSLTQT